MPYNYTHALLGESALQGVLPRTRACIEAHAGAFRIGTMGPDPYFGDAMPKPLFAPCRVDLAARFHALDARTLFGAMLPLAAGDDARMAYTLGFLCHFLLDAAAHPYIEARFGGKLHTPSEIQMDLMMVERFAAPGWLTPPRRYYRTDSLDTLDALHAALCKTLFAEETAGVFRRGFHKWIAINSLSFDPENHKKDLFSAFGRAGAPCRVCAYLVARHKDSNDRLNQRHAIWRAPWEPARARTESFTDLFTAACAEAPALLDAAAEAMLGGDATRALKLAGARRMDARPL